MGRKKIILHTWFPILGREISGQWYERMLKLMHVNMLLTISTAKLIYYVQIVEFYSLLNLQNQQYQYSGH